MRVINILTNTEESQMIIIPAYGRQYLSAKEALQDWFDGKYFKLYNGPYCSVRDIELLKEKFSEVHLYPLWPMPGRVDLTNEDLESHL